MKQKMKRFCYTLLFKRTAVALTVLIFIVAGINAQENTIRLKAGAQSFAYSPLIFRQFIEHFDNQVYGGIYDPGNPLSDEDGLRTDEYIMWCHKVGCEPYICTNAGTGTPEEMSDWVEYCNLSIGKWGRMRMANGHKEPYNVKYWSVSNENWGAHELGARTVQEWGPMVRESAKLIRSVAIPAHSITFLEIKR